MSVAPRKLTNPTMCGIVSILAFIAAICVAFPQVFGLLTGRKFLSVFVPILMMGVGFVVLGLIFDFIAKRKKLALVLGVTAFGAITLYFGAFTTEIAVKAAAGLPVDEFGTIVPISPVGVLAFAVAALLGSICLAKHAFFPLFPDQDRLKRAFFCALTVITLFIWVSSLTTAFISLPFSKAPFPPKAHTQAFHKS